jgi:hypothetical protein
MLKLMDRVLKVGNIAIAEAKRENEVYEKHLIAFAKKIGLHKKSKTIEEAGNKALLWMKEKEKYKIYH